MSPPNLNQTELAMPHQPKPRPNENPKSPRTDGATLSDNYSDHPVPMKPPAMDEHIQQTPIARNGNGNRNGNNNTVNSQFAEVIGNNPPPFLRGNNDNRPDNANRDNSPTNGPQNDGHDASNDPNNTDANHHHPTGKIKMDRSTHSLGGFSRGGDSLGGSQHSMVGGGQQQQHHQGGDGSGAGADGNPTTAMLDACIRDLSRRRMVMAQQAAATASAVAAASGGGGPGGGGGGNPGADGRGGGGGMSNAMAAAGMGQMPVGAGGVGMPSQAMMNAAGGTMGSMGARSAVAASAMGIKTEQHNPHSGMGGPGMGGGGGGGKPGSGLADYAGTAADSFAQAFVDRWASSHNKDPSGGVPNMAAMQAAAQQGGGGGMTSAQASAMMQAAGGGGNSNLAGGAGAAGGGVSQQQLTNNSYHSLTSEGSNPNNQRRSSDASAGGGGGGGGSSKQWWVCDFCKNKAFISRVELKEHEGYCEMNPMKSGGGSGGGPAGISTGLGGAGQGGGMSAAQAMSAAASNMNAATQQAMLGNSMHSAGTISRGGSIGSSIHSIGHGHPGMVHPGMAHRPQHPQAVPSAGAWAMGGMGMNPYAHMNMMCGDPAGMMMNPHAHPAYGGMGAMGMPPPGMGMPNIAEAAAAAAAQPSRRKSSVPAINPEIIEASKGPFRQLPKPLALALDEDKDWLTPLHCFVRKHCVEVFTATELDVQTPSKGKRKPIQVGQIGIRCPHCHEGRMDTDPNRERGSVYYPTSLSSIYNATMNLLQRHLHSCPKVPAHVMEKYTELKKDDARSGTSKKYWIESAKSLGFVDTLQGIKLSAKKAPPPPSTSVSQRQTKEARGRSESDAERKKKDGEEGDEKKDGEEGEEDDKEKGEGNEEEGDEKKVEPPAEAPPLVIPADVSTATQFSFLLLGQMQPCVFTEADRLGKRKGLPTGFAGLACRHCFGGYGSGRFFPSSIKTLSDTSKTLNVLHNHMSRCRKVPKETLEELEEVRATHDDERAKMKFGSQKAFFAKIWSRLHDNRPDGVVIKPPPRKPQNASQNGAMRRLSSTASATSAMGIGQQGMMQRWGSAGSMGMNMMNPAMMMGGQGMGGMGAMMGGGGGGMPQQMMQQHPMMAMGGGMDPQHMMSQMGAGAMPPGMGGGMGMGGGYPGGMGMPPGMGGVGQRESINMGGGGDLGSSQHSHHSMGGSMHHSHHSMGGSNHGNVGPSSQMGGGGMVGNKRSMEMMQAMQADEMRKRMRQGMPPNANI